MMTDNRMGDLLQAAMRDCDTPSARRVCKALMDRSTPGALLAARIIMVGIERRSQVIEQLAVERDEKLRRRTAEQFGGV